MIPPEALDILFQALAGIAATFGVIVVFGAAQAWIERNE